jgi:hypothetical protein
VGKCGASVPPVVVPFRVGDLAWLMVTASSSKEKPASAVWLVGVFMLACRLTWWAVRESMVEEWRSRSFGRRSSDGYVGLLSDSACCGRVNGWQMKMSIFRKKIKWRLCQLVVWLWKLCKSQWLTNEGVGLSKEDRVTAWLNKSGGCSSSVTFWVC